ncbi:MAG: V-type ATP synthase subunit F [Candidatus Omnitrophica bacterium]|nr:V-type ATP synthase subunit F [Candidatus Omnitrophota bacterium]
MTFFCIADKDSSVGFKLSGIETREVSTRSDALEALRVALATENIGVILITEKITTFINEEIEELTYQRQLPLILKIPSRGLASKSTGMGEFLKKAIGISV